MSSDVIQDLPQLTAKKLGKARELARNGKTVAALRLYQEVTRFDPRDGYAWLEYADVLTDLLRFREAFDAYQQALDYAPKDKRCFVFARVGILLEQSVGVVEAGEYYRQAVEPADEPAAWIHILYGKNLLVQGEHEKAESRLLRAAELESPERGEAYLNLAILYRATERYSDCEKMAKKLLAIEPANRDAKVLLESITPADRDGK